METNDQLTMRRCQPSDGVAIQAINLAGAPGVSPLTDAELAALADGSVRCWVAEDAGQVVGYLITYTNSDPYDGEEFAWFQQRVPTFLYIDQVAIASSHRRRGVGATLYRQAAEDAHTTGLESLTCEVNLDPPNPTSLAFHQELGFVNIGELHTGDGRYVTLLRKPLAPFADV